ncbi:MAG: hypothetical protein LBN02_09515 [Oscillospiraceae bacterium]|nr:hypothetical protein [Oscillospiraceae bacterium]
MYYYLGGGEVVDDGEIIGVFDADNCTAAKSTREYLERRQSRGELKSLADGEPRYIVVTASRRGEKAYFTQFRPKSVV